MTTASTWEGLRCEEWVEVERVVNDEGLGRIVWESCDAPVLMQEDETGPCAHVLQVGVDRWEECGDKRQDGIHEPGVDHAYVAPTKAVHVDPEVELHHPAQVSAAEGIEG